MNKHKTIDLDLLPLQYCIKTGPVDYAGWNYKFILGYIQRMRFKLALSLIKNKCYNNILEIGYGSGIFLPTLSKFCNELCAIDIHDKSNKVKENLEKFGVKATLHTASCTKIPFPNNYFDLIISISTFEFIEELEAACEEINRVMNSNGLFCVINPNKNLFLDFGFNILTGKKAEDDFHGRRNKLNDIINKYFQIQKTRKIPIYMPSFIKLYTGLLLSKY